MTKKINKRNIKLLNNRKLLTIIFPVFNEENGIHEFMKTLVNIIKTTLRNNNLPENSFELIGIDDCSTDSSKQIIQEFLQKHKCGKCISHNKNYGHQTALDSGLKESSGEAIIFIDSDFQDPPKLIEKMFDKFLQGFDIVHTIRTQRKKESIFKKISAWVYYKLLRTFSSVDIPLSSADFKLISNKAKEMLLKISCRNHFLRGWISSLKLPSCCIYYIREGRKHGNSRYPLLHSLKLATDGIALFAPKLIVLLGISSLINFIIVFLSRKKSVKTIINSVQAFTITAFIKLLKQRSDLLRNAIQEKTIYSVDVYF